MGVKVKAKCSKRGNRASVKRKMCDGSLLTVPNLGEQRGKNSLC